MILIEQVLGDLNLPDYKIVDCEPLYDVKGHLHHLLTELHVILNGSPQITCQDRAVAAYPAGPAVAGPTLTAFHFAKSLRCSLQAFVRVQPSPFSVSLVPRLP